ncbi:11180_t:CDS:10 [Diversispora eburnea]|uniref:Glutamyl-tRNA(Gln) amidotransferase subunit A, mitochondrial n=1 Tax=Diversispora eburnea TaxID=1213867 RepID=A0A9N9C911_9GLOM|nr:11180_t:CDS:10 [Diversispora eburnea]
MKILSGSNNVLSNFRKSRYKLSSKARQLNLLSITEANKLLREKKLLPTTLVQDCLSRLKKYNAQVNAFIEVQKEEVILQKAREAENRINEGINNKSLDGIPIAYKDNFCTQDLTTTCGSNMLRNFTSPFNATVVELLRDAGSIIIGKTNMDEYGMGAFGPVYNPHKIISDQESNIDKYEKRVAGGSSGGSAAAVASGMCFAALGSDTGGSVRLPASYCGVIGFKPSYGLCSRWGLIAYANSFDTDSTSLSPKLRAFNSLISRNSPLNKNNPLDLGGLRVGVPKEYMVSELSEPIIKLWRKGISFLKSQGAKIISVSCQNTKYALSTYYILAPAEASSNLARYDGVRYGYQSEKDSSQLINDNDNDNEDTGLLYANTRDEGFGIEVKRRIMLGTFTLTTGSYENYYLRAQKIRKLIQLDFNKVFQGVDVLITPVTISISPKISDYNNDNFLNFYVNDIFTIPANLVGIPAISIPFGKLHDYPIGLQLMSQYGDDLTLFKVAKILEQM